MSSISRTNWPADHVSAAAEPAGLPFLKPIEATVGPVGGQRPLLEVALELVRHAAPHVRAVGVAVEVGDPGRGEQAGDLGRDRRRREAVLLLPALRPAGG